MIPGDSLWVDELLERSAGRKFWLRPLPEAAIPLGSSPPKVYKQMGLFANELICLWAIC